MRIKTLQKILNTDFIIANYNNEYLGIGLSTERDLIKIDKELNIKIRGGVCSNDVIELNRIHKILTSMSQEELSSILNENDPIENLITVYRFEWKTREVIETQCETLCHGCYDIDGFEIDEYSHFPDKISALKYCIKTIAYKINFRNGMIKEYNEKIQKYSERIDFDSERIIAILPEYFLEKEKGEQK